MNPVLQLSPEDWLSLFNHFASLSLLAVGGAITTAPDMQRYVVQVPERAFVQLLKLGAVAVIAPEKFGNQFYELVAQSLYSPIAGLNFSDPVAMSAETAVF